MRRTTVYLDAELELMLERESRRLGRPMAALIRDAIRAHLGRKRAPEPPGAGAFASGHADTAERVDAALRESGFGDSD